MDFVLEFSSPPFAWPCEQHFYIRRTCSHNQNIYFYLYRILASSTLILSVIREPVWARHDRRNAITPIIRSMDSKTPHGSPLILHTLVTPTCHYHLYRIPPTLGHPFQNCLGHGASVV